MASLGRWGALVLSLLGAGGCVSLTDEDLKFRQGSGDGAEGEGEGEGEGDDTSTDCPDGSAPGSWYADADGDGYGDPDALTMACDQPDGTSGDSDDCDDTDPAVSPEGTEICGGADEDCDGEIDEAGAEGESTWYADGDGDGYGDDAIKSMSCSQPDGYVAGGGDCDDSNIDSFPGAEEVCGDGVITDCAMSEEDAWEACGGGALSLEDGHAIVGSSESMGFGRRAVAMGDLDGRDGDDLVVLADQSPEDTSGSYMSWGTVSFFSNADLADCWTSPCNSDDAFLDIAGPGSRSTAYGASLVPLGDLQSDGFDDLLITFGGAMYDSIDGPTDASNGVAIVFFGSGDWGGSIELYDGRTDVTPTGTVALWGDEASQYLGLDATAISDSSGNTWLALDAAGQWSVYNTGAVFFVDPIASTTSTGPVSDSAAGTLYGTPTTDPVNSATARITEAISRLGDFDGDGQEDLAVGGYNCCKSDDYPGHTLVISEVPDSEYYIEDVAALTLRGAEDCSSAGADVAAAGDVNGDAYQDLLVGSPGIRRSGVATCGDTYAGSMSLILGCMSSEDASCKGTISLASANATFTGGDDGDYVGAAGTLASLGDANGDGSDDVGIGAPGQGDAGAVYVLLGPLSGSLGPDDAALTLAGGRTGDQLGYGIATSPDLDGDGVGELLLGAIGSDDGVSNGGATWVLPLMPW